jgi:hypothetical protein
MISDVFKGSPERSSDSKKSGMKIGRCVMVNSTGIAKTWIEGVLGTYINGTEASSWVRQERQKSGGAGQTTSMFGGPGVQIQQRKVKKWLSSFLFFRR